MGGWKGAPPVGSWTSPAAACLTCTLCPTRLLPCRRPLDISDKIKIMTQNPPGLLLCPGWARPPFPSQALSCLSSLPLSPRQESPLYSSIVLSLSEFTATSVRPQTVQCHNPPSAMDTEKVYVNFKPSRTPGPKHASAPSLPSDACRCPHWHQWALKLGCAGLILLVLGLIGFSVLVRFLIQKCSADVQANTAVTTGTLAILQCPRDWHPHGDKCLVFSQTSRPWSEGLADCSAKEATLLLVQDQEELRFIQDVSKDKEKLFWIGLNYISSEKIWKWVNGSVLHSDLLKITGESKQNSCAVVSRTQVFSEACSSDNYWVCQKKLKPV